MKYFIPFLLIVFVSITVFSIFGMHASMQDHTGDCIAAAAQGAGCPKQNNPLGYIAFHFGAFKGFSTAILVNIVSLFSILFFLLLGIIFVIFLPGLIPQKSARYQLHRKDLFGLSSQYKFSYWLALHENSPAIL